MRRVGLEELTAKTPEPAHDFNLVISPLGTILVLPVATATGRASVFYSFSSGSFGAICSPFRVWFWCVPDRDDGFMAMFHNRTPGEVTSSLEPCDRVTHPTGLL